MAGESVCSFAMCLCACVHVFSRTVRAMCYRHVCTGASEDDVSGTAACVRCRLLQEWPCERPKRVTCRLHLVPVIDMHVHALDCEIKSSTRNRIHAHTHAHDASRP
eukprot:25995-Eustigmatos_ZCMA.PRE.1